MKRAQHLVLLSAVLFGTTGTAQALGPDGTQPLTVGASRIAIGGAALIAIALVTRTLRDGIAWAPGPAVAGALGVAGYQVCFFAAVDAEDRLAPGELLVTADLGLGDENRFGPPRPRRLLARHGSIPPPTGARTATGRLPRGLLPGDVPGR